MIYEYDPFQKKAIEAIEKEHSVLVSAPTGCGKTAIAEFAITRSLERGENVIYTAPIKALSNQKYRDFLVHYPTKVGILTGDVAINPDAQILIMTTEIYRNQLFENPDRHRRTAWVIFDEVHYVDDPERGTVWEEAIMFSHPDTRFLALSATVPNVREIADWIESIHNHAITVVEETHRPVKLVHHFQCQNRIFNDLDEPPPQTKPASILAAASRSQTE
jgi:superfamily II RNA helicase